MRDERSERASLMNDIPPGLDQIVQTFAQDVSAFIINNMLPDVAQARADGEAEGYRVARLNAQQEDRAVDDYRQRLLNEMAMGNEVEIATTVGGKFKGIIQEVTDRTCTVRPNMVGAVVTNTIHIAAIIQLTSFPQV